MAFHPPDCDVQLVAPGVEGGQPLAVGDGVELLDAGRHEVGEDERQAHVEEEGIDAVDVEGGQDVLEGCEGRSEMRWGSGRGEIILPCWV